MKHGFFRTKFDGSVERLPVCAMIGDSVSKELCAASVGK